VDLDEIEKELKKAAKAVESASQLVGMYRARLESLCDHAALQPTIRTDRDGGMPVKNSITL
jgi:hypothetical protein